MDTGTLEEVQMLPLLPRGGGGGGGGAEVLVIYIICIAGRFHKFHLGFGLLGVEEPWFGVGFGIFKIRTIQSICSINCIELKNRQVVKSSVKQKHNSLEVT
jgi:hypothetical protein